MSHRLRRGDLTFDSHGKAMLVKKKIGALPDITPEAGISILNQTHDPAQLNRPSTGLNGKGSEIYSGRSQGKKKTKKVQISELQALNKF